MSILVAMDEVMKSCFDIGKSNYEAIVLEAALPMSCHVHKYSHESNDRFFYYNSTALSR